MAILPSLSAGAAVPEHQMTIVVRSAECKSHKAQEKTLNYGEVRISSYGALPVLSHIVSSIYQLLTAMIEETGG